MPLSVKETFEQHSDLTPDDTGLVKRILEYEQYILNKTPEHTEFFGGNLIGYPIVRWNERVDDRKWLEDVCLIEDINQCQKDLYECEHIERDHAVPSSIFNLSVVWILHVIYLQAKKAGSMRNFIVHKDGGVSSTPAVEAALTINMIRHLTSFMWRRFEHGSNPGIAQAMFEGLDNKHDFKVAGSWINLIRERTDIFLNTEGRYPDAWINMTDDDVVVRMCREVNGNLRSTVNILTSRYHDQRKMNDRIMSSSHIGEMEGEKVIKDYIRKADKLRDEMKRISREPNALIKGELLETTLEFATTAKEEHVEACLNYYSDNFNSDKEKYYEIPNTMVTFILELARRKEVDFDNMYSVITRIRSLFRSSGTTNKDVLQMKKDISRLVKKAIPKERHSVQAATASAFSTYLVFRIMTVDHYK